MDVSENELVRRAQSGDTAAFEALVLAHQTLAYNLALRALGDEREAEDTAQEAFVRAWLALPNFRGQARFGTWLYRIITNLCCNRHPRLRRELLALGDEAVSTLPDESPETDPAISLEAEERRAFLYHQIDALPESYRMLVTLRFQHELSYEDIARTLSLPLGTVKTGLFRARARLREALLVFEAGERL